MKKVILGLALFTGFISCTKETKDCPSSTERTYTESGFTKVSAGATFTVKITQGTSYSIKAKGCSNDLNDLRIENSQGQLEIEFNGYRNDRYRVDLEITMPFLTSINLSGAAKGTVTGFSPQSTFMRAVMSGTATCTINDIPDLVAADLSGAAELSLHGATTDLVANLSGTSRLNAYGTTADDVDLSTSGTAKAYVQARQSLVVIASGDSRIYYKGNPSNLQVDRSGSAQVIHE
jgi:hypothetical protein